MDLITLSASPRTPEIEHLEVLGRTILTARWRASHDAVAQRPLLFFTGIGANIELMAPFLELLTGRDVITFDVPGIGGSPAPVMPYRPRAIAELGGGLLDLMGYGAADVMGVSWGGMIAQQFAADHPERVGRLILAATSSGALMVPGKLSALVRMLNPRRYADVDYMDEHFDTLYGGTRQGLGGYLARMQAPSTLGYLYQLLAISGWTSLGFLPFLSAPTLILNGSHDNLVRPVNARILARLIRNARCETVEGGGHMFLLTHRREVSAMVENWLAREQQASAGTGQELQPASVRQASARACLTR